MLWRELTKTNEPFATEMLGDPWDGFAPGAWASISRPFFRIMATSQLKRVCAGSTAVNYVTSKTLQARYPASRTAYVTNFSDVTLENARTSARSLRERHRRLSELPWSNPERGDPFHIGFVGNFSLYKGADILLRAAALCERRSLNFSLTMVGQGRYLAELKSIAQDLGIVDRTHFPGSLPFGSIFRFLDTVDLFVLPSRQEGLPRALLEAMARGCPCIGSDIGGIPELLESSDLVPPGNSSALADKILHLAPDANRLLAMSLRNFAKTAEYDPEALKQARRNFLRAVAQRSSLK
jgi:glycosyltransferase involved in cell wall biosynthesis